MKKRLIALSIGVLAIALIAAGCGDGGGDDEGEPNTTSITKAEFIKKADVICTKNDEQIESEFGDYLKENFVKESEETVAETEARFTEIFETIVGPVMRREIDELRALGSPSGDEDQIDTMLEAFEDSLEKSEDAPAEALRSNVEVLARPKALAERYGIKVCGY